MSVWLDDLSRDRLRSGKLAELRDTKCVVGVTTNPSIFQAALSAGNSYDAQVAELADRGADVEATVRTVTTDDVREACDLFAEVYRASDGIDGRVSIEVDPRLAHDTDKTILQAIELWKIVDRPNVLIKIPATEAGLPAITAVIGEGISVNVTLIFSVQRHRAVMDAYLAGLQAAGQAGHDLSKIHSVASFFVSRVDTEIDNRLETIGTDEALALRGQAGVANARLAYAAYQDVFLSGDRYKGTEDRRRAGAAPPVGLDRSEEPGLLRHPLRHRTGRPQHREHHAGEDPRGGRRPWRHHRRHRHRPGRRSAGSLRQAGSRRHRPDRGVHRAGGRGRGEVREVMAGVARRNQGQLDTQAK